jgi:uncharacterized protein (TIGR02996 family)
MSEVDSLQRAAAALNAGDTPGARAALLDAWKTGRAPAVADLLSLLDVRQPDELVKSLDSVIAPRVNTTLDRFTPLVRRDDPRVSAFALGALERLPFTTPGAQTLLETFVRVVAQRKDVRLLPRAKAIREALRTRLTRAPVRDALLAEFDDAVITLKALELKSSAEAIALHEALRNKLSSLAAPAKSEEGLLDAVYANPREDDPRLVYADWLLERGDERGEFITLQFKRRTEAYTPADEKREAALIKKYGKKWLGALAPVLSFGKGYSGTRFERGFISQADIILSVGKKLEPLWHAKEWSTVEYLEGNWPLELLERAPLRGLKGVGRSLHSETLKALRKGRRTLAAEEVELTEDIRDWELVRAVLPHLKELAVWWRDVPTIQVIQEYAQLGVSRLVLRRTWNAPRGPDQDAAFAQLLEALRTTKLPFAELGLMPAWVGNGRPDLIELIPSAEGMIVNPVNPHPDPLPKGEGATDRVG